MDPRGVDGELSDPGDYVAAFVADTPIVVVRGGKGELRAFHNLCRHRGMVMLEGWGNVDSSIDCIYHQWRYDLEGALKVVPQRKEQFPELDLDAWGLLPAALDVWHGMVFVNPDPAAPSLHSYLSALTESLGSFRPGLLAQVAHDLIDARCNWKLFVENHVDVYHLWYLHEQTLGDFDHTKFHHENVDGHWISYEPLRVAGFDEARLAAGTTPIQHLDERDRVGISAHFAFPTSCFADVAAVLRDLSRRPGRARPVGHRSPHPRRSGRRRRGPAQVRALLHRGGHLGLRGRATRVALAVLLGGAARTGPRAPHHRVPRPGARGPGRPGVNPGALRTASSARGGASPSRSAAPVPTSRPTSSGSRRRCGFADVRIPRRHGTDPVAFAGSTTWDDPALTWHHSLDLARVPADVGVVEWRGDDLVERGVMYLNGEPTTYEEVWRREPGGASPIMVLTRDRSHGNGLSSLVRVGDHAIVMAMTDHGLAARRDRRVDGTWRVVGSIGSAALPAVPEPGPGWEPGPQWCVLELEV